MNETVSQRATRLAQTLDRAMPRHPCSDAQKISTFDYLQAAVTQIQFEADPPQMLIGVDIGTGDRTVIIIRKPDGTVRQLTDREVAFVMTKPQPSYEESLAALKMMPGVELSQRLRDMNCPPNISLHELMIEAARRLPR